MVKNTMILRNMDKDLALNPHKYALYKDLCVEKAQELKREFLELSNNKNDKEDLLNFVALKLAQLEIKMDIVNNSSGMTSHW